MVIGIRPARGLAVVAATARSRGTPCVRSKNLIEPSVASPAASLSSGCGHSRLSASAALAICIWASSEMNLVADSARLPTSVRTAGVRPEMDVKEVTGSIAWRPYSGSNGGGAEVDAGLLTGAHVAL